MPRIIKKYPNRKLYDIEASRTITLAELSQFIKEGYDIKVIDKNTEEDITDVTLVEVLRYELRDGKEFASFPFILKELIKAGKSTLYEFIKSTLVASVEAISLTEMKTKELVRGLVDKKKLSPKEALELERVLLEAVKERQKLLEEKIRRIVQENTDQILKGLGLQSMEDLERKIEHGSYKILDQLGLKNGKDIDRRIQEGIKRTLKEMNVPDMEEYRIMKEDIKEIKKGIGEILERLKRDEKMD